MNSTQPVHNNMYDNAWEQALQSGREDFGDLECDIAVIQKTGLLEKHHEIIEFGCGIGKLCRWLTMNGYNKVTGIDISRPAVDYGTRLFPDLNLVCADASTFHAPPATFDICLSFDFLEHLQDVQSHLAMAYTLLKPGGKYITQTPNYLPNALYSTLIARGFGWRKSHPSLQTRTSLKNNFFKAGFTRVQPYKVSPVSEFKLRHLPIPLRKIFSSIPWVKLPWFMQIGIYAAAWKQDN